MSPARYATEKPVSIAMLFLAIALLGAISFVRLPIDLLPDVAYPKLVVFTSYSDVAPAEVEGIVTSLVEANAAAVPGVESVTSVSREGVSLVTLRFAWGTDMDFAMLNTRERMDDVRDRFPDGVRPRILRVDPESEPIMVLSVSGGSHLWQTKELVETVFRRRLEQLDGVAQAAVTGGLDREIQVDLEPELLEAYGLTPADVSGALALANVRGSGGQIREGDFRYPLRTIGELRTVNELNDVVVARPAAPGGGERGSRRVRLRDVGTVTDGFAEPQAIARLDGREAVGLLLFKEAGANTVAVADQVDEVVAQLQSEYPGVQLDVASSQAGFISGAIDNLIQEVIVGGFLAFLVLFLFLRDPRYPVVVSAAIPASVLATFALMDVFGVSLNIMSLGGLALGVGMLVDNSIVVLENIFRHREMGKDPMEAAAIGAEEVGGAITASTLTTIGVFAPIIYVEGVAGQLFRDLSLSIAFSLLASILVAMTLLPAWAGRFDVLGGSPAATPPGGPRPMPIPAAVGFSRKLVRLGRVGGRAFGRVAATGKALAGELVVFWGRGVGAVLSRTFTPVLDAFDRGLTRFAEWYHELLVKALDRPWQTLAVSGAALAVALFVGFELPRDLLPEVEQGAFDVRVQLPEGTPLQSTADAATTLEGVLLADPGVEAVFSRIGRDVRAYGEGEETTDVDNALLQVRLRPGESTPEVLDRLRPHAQVVNGVVTMQAGRATTLGRMLGGEAADVAVRIRGEDFDSSYARAEVIASRLASVDRLSNVRIGTERGTPQLRVEILRDKAIAYGIAPRDVSETIERAMRGSRATEFVAFDRRIAVMVRYPEALRHSRETLESLRVHGVPVRELIDVREVLGPAEVRREDQSRVITVYADVARGGLGAAIAAVQGELRSLPPTRALRMEVGGENEEMRRSFRDLGIALALAVAIMYMVLAAEFESFALPFIVLMAVPLSIVGAVLGLVVSGGSVNTISLIGLVVLAGIVDNDAVVKVHFIQQARAAGMSVRDAILEAGRVRLRPILMTGSGTIVGLIPVAMAVGAGGQLQAPMAQVVIGGLLVATLLTLVVIPVIYFLMERGGEEAVERSGAPVPREAVPQGAG